MFSKFKTFIACVLCITFTFGAYAAEDYPEAKDKDIKKAQTAQARFDRTTDDGSWYIYKVTLNAPVSDAAKPTLTIYNPSLGPTEYTVNNYAGSLTRKELSCTDADGQVVTIIFKIEEKPGARNANVLNMYVDKYPGENNDRQSIVATCVNNIYQIKDSYQGTSIRYSETNSKKEDPHKYKTNIYPTLFDWMEYHLKQ